MYTIEQEMHTIEQEILNAIGSVEINTIWIILITVLILFNTCGLYSLLKKLIKFEKEKKEDRKRILSILENIENKLNMK